MTYAEEIKMNLLPGVTTPIRAVIYARVSTDNDSQKDSCDNQVALAEKYIAVHPNIKLIATFVDDGISGKNDFTRPKYNEMLQELSNNGFDVILTKALSRLNRDELNSLLLRSMLLEHNATVITLEDGQVHDFEDINSSLVHSLKYAIDAQYVKQQSINGRKTQELRCERKELSAKDCSFGYDWHREDKTITINEEQAEIVRWIFEEFVFRNGTPASIHKMLAEKGISLCSRSVSNIIKDERYLGRFYINKRTSKLGTGHTKSKRIILPKEQWVLCERPDLQIIDYDLFELAQRVHHTRVTVYEKPDKKTTQARFQGTHNFAGKVFCPICRKPFLFGYADRKKTLPVYRVRNHSECINPIRRVYEHDLIEITKQALNQTINRQNEVCSALEKILTDVVTASQNNEEEIDKLRKQRTSREKQIDNLINQLSEGGLTEAARNLVIDKINHITDETNKLTETIGVKEANKLDDSFVSEKMNAINTAIADLRNFSSIDRDRILNYIERIDMYPNGDIEILLKSGQAIFAKQHNGNDFSNGISVGKKRIQDVLC